MLGKWPCAGWVRTSMLLTQAGKNSRMSPSENEWGKSTFYSGRDREARTQTPGDRISGWSAHCPPPLQVSQGAAVTEVKIAIWADVGKFMSELHTGSVSLGILRVSKGGLCLTFVVPNSDSAFCPGSCSKYGHHRSVMVFVPLGPTSIVMSVFTIMIV